MSDWVQQWRDTPHVPSLVTELPPHRWMLCLRCQEVWPCKQAGK